MKKLLSIILCLFLISCSNLYKAGKAYERGDYVENVVLTFKYFDEKPENFKELNEKKKRGVYIVWKNRNKKKNFSIYCLWYNKSWNCFWWN